VDRTSFGEEVAAEAYPGSGPEIEPHLSTTRRFAIGRSPDCHIVLHHTHVSGIHAYLEATSGVTKTWSLVDAASTNGCYVNRLDSRAKLQRLEDDDLVFISKHYSTPARWMTDQLSALQVTVDDEMLRITGLSVTAQAALRQQTRPLPLVDAAFLPGVRQEDIDIVWCELVRRREASAGPRSPSLSGQLIKAKMEVLRIGRAPDNDLILSSLRVGLHHAELVRRADGLRFLRDLGSAEGCYVNDRLIRGGELQVQAGDRIEISGFSLSLMFLPGDPTVGNVGFSPRGFYIEVRGVSQSVPDREHKGRPLILLDYVDAVIYPGEVVGLMGPSGCGKTTLMKIMNGCERATAGGVFYDNVNLEQNLGRFTSQIGYVPQDDIMHPELTVRETLFYAARLRLPKEVTDLEVTQKVEEVVNDLGLKDRLGTQIGSPERKGLSGGQKKRVNLAMELMTDPKILFLDEPTSGLSSKDTSSVMELLRRIARERQIAIVITIHQPSLRNYQRLDQVIYLKQGRLSYFGRAWTDSVSYFVTDTPPELAGPDSVMEVLDEVDAAGLQQRFRASPLYRRNISERSQRVQQLLAGQGAPGVKPAVPFHQQVWQVTERYYKCKLRDSVSLLVQLAQAPFIGILLLYAFYGMHLSQPTFLLVFIALWFGTNNAAREIVSERVIYEREHRCGLSPAAYLLSKIIVQSVLLALQCIMLVIPVWAVLDFAFNPLLGILLCWIVGIVGACIGLCVSAFVRSQMTAIALVPLVLIPFILFGGLMKRYDEMRTTDRLIASLVPARWGYDALVQLDRLGVPNDELSRLSTRAPFASSDPSPVTTDGRARARLWFWFCTVLLLVKAAILGCLTYWRLRRF